MPTPAVLSAPLRAHPAKGILVVRGVTQRKVARDLSFNVSAVSRMLSGAERTTPRFRRALAGYLGLPEGELFIGGGDP